VRADGSLFAAVYRDHHQALYRYVRSIVRDPVEAEDVLQAAMVKAFAALRSEERDFELRPWLFRIAHNEAISRVRQQRPTVELDGSLQSAGGSLSEVVDDRARLTQLWGDLAELPERQRQALVLRELNGLGHKEIGEVLGTSGRAVKQTIFEARVTLSEFAEGREMRCVEVQRTLSDGDGRIRRGRRMRAHLRSCQACRGFDAALSRRPGELAALAPALPAAASTALMGHLLPAAKASMAGCGSAGAAGGPVAAALLTKATIVVVSGIAIAGTAGGIAHRVTTAPPPAEVGRAGPTQRSTQRAIRVQASRTSSILGHASGSAATHASAATAGAGRLPVGRNHRDGQPATTPATVADSPAPATQTRPTGEKPHASGAPASASVHPSASSHPGVAGSSTHKNPASRPANASRPARPPTVPAPGVPVSDAGSDAGAGHGAWPSAAQPPAGQPGGASSGSAAAPVGGASGSPGTGPGPPTGPGSAGSGGSADSAPRLPIAN
jgi:RNA polymerase sigma factor (sigma-70 family)